MRHTIGINKLLHIFIVRFHIQLRSDIYWSKQLEIGVFKSESECIWIQIQKSYTYFYRYISKHSASFHGILFCSMWTPTVPHLNLNYWTCIVIKSRQQCSILLHFEAQQQRVKNWFSIRRMRCCFWFERNNMDNK